ncbi:MAG: hypothetical protein NTX15_11595 [Candidatus Kapabacteria bacterium]|nr:hypothetical protein [Candidatus Kapabacteria bacterium]
MSRYFITVSLLIVLSILPTIAQDSVSTGGQVIRGTVLDAVSNAPITGATVAVFMNGKRIKGAVVKKNGTFRVAKCAHR